MKRAAALLVLLLAASAQAEDLEQAKALFSAGAAAYDKHDYIGAIRAFEGAQRAAPRPPIVFSLAQAHRHQFFVDGSVDHQHAAIDLFREYVKQVPTGGRHEDAMRALQELGALAPQRDVSSVSINSSGTPGARVALDGAPPVSAPLIGPVAPGKHHALISADGFSSEERDVIAVEGQIVALDVPLKEKVARVTIASPAGASVDVDGRPMGETPLRAAIDVPAGAHMIAIGKNGHVGWAKEINLARGEQRRIDAALPVTKQRNVATALLVTSAVTLTAAATFAAVAGAYHAQAESILTKQRTQNIGLDDIAAYNFARDARGSWLIASGLSFGGAALLAATGIVLFTFDKPQTTTTHADEKAKPLEQNKEPTELSISPIVSPTTLGASARLRF